MYKGYCRVDLHKDNGHKTIKVHRLVALMFIPNPENKPEVNHKWGIKTDNRASELEWNTNRENIQHAFNTGLRSIEQCKMLSEKYAKIRAEKLERQIEQYTLQGKLIKTWKSIKEAKTQLGILHISECCSKKRQTAGGYIWKYKDTQ